MPVALAGPLIAAAGSILGGLFGSKGSKDAAKVQTDAADRALAVFEKNAGISQDILKESTNTAINTIEAGRERSRTNLRDAADAGIATLTSASTDSRKTLRDSAAEASGTLGRAANDTIESLTRGANSAIDTLSARRNTNRDNILQAFGLLKGEINSAAIASSGLINAAREKAVGTIVSGYGEAANSILQGRDLVNKILQDSTASASEKLELAKAGAIAAQDRGLTAIRSDFQPFMDAGKISLDQVQKLISDPAAQKDFIENNPFFDSLADKAESRLLANQAARGRVGSGSTQKELHNELILLGNNLLDSTINQRMGLVNTGMAATGQVAGAETNRANSVSAVEQQTGKSLSELAAQLGVNMGNNETGAARSIADLAVSRGKDIAATETSAGKDLAQIEKDRGTGVADAVGSGIALLTNTQTGLDRDIAQTQSNLGTSVGNVQSGLGKAQADIQSTLGINDANNQSALGKDVATIQTKTGADIANLNTAATDATATLQAAEGVNQSNILTGQAAHTADTLIGKGDAQAAGIVGGTNAVTGTISDLATIGVNALETPEQKAARLAREAAQRNGTNG